MPPSILRAIYVCEFWLVLLTVHVVWPQAGGQTHLDIMAWHWKLFLPAAFSLAIVGLTVAAVEGETFWGRKTLSWLLLVLTLALAIALVTYYYHLHENDNSEDPIPEDTAVLLLSFG